MSQPLEEYLVECQETGSFPDGKMSVSSKTISGDTPLHFAALQGNLSVVRLLVEAGSDVNVRGESEYTPLDYAVEFNNVEVIEFLQSMGAITNMEDAPNNSLKVDGPDGPQP